MPLEPHGESVREVIDGVRAKGGRGERTMVIAAALCPHDDWQICLGELDMPAAAGMDYGRMFRWPRCRQMVATIGGMIAAYCSRALRVAGAMFTVVAAGGAEIECDRAVATQAQIQRRAAPAKELREC
jgi:hypothetical protein